MKMKKILVGLLALGSFSVFAGDFTVNCHLEGDVGNYINSEEIFDSSINSIYTEFKHKEYDYKVFVEREDYLSNYTYTVMKIQRSDMSFSRSIFHVPDYSVPIKVNSEVTCVTKD
jgi:hypothetical protein